MNFSILTPLPPSTWLHRLGGGWGGMGGGGWDQNFFVDCSCVWIWTWSCTTCFLCIGPLTHGGPRVLTPDIPPPPRPLALASEDLAIFTLDRLFSGT